MMSHVASADDFSRRAALVLTAMALCAAIALTASSDAHAEESSGSPRSISGIYPHLAMFNNEAECGTGAVVPWADRLWIVTYGPHAPKESSDKLYEVTPDLHQIVRAESVGGTHANRMIHRESNQLFIGRYAIDGDRKVRVIPWTAMFGRLTGIARHLADPSGRLCFATMEEGIYDVDVRTLAATEHWADEQVKAGRHADLPGYHGKGFYSGQGRLIYSNNGDHAREAMVRPDVPSGCLAEWDGRAAAWKIVRRNQFTDVTGPGGIEGAGRPESDPVWSIGWDHRSLILLLLDEGTWHAYRLPKGSHSYDGAHGWNTEWPRIRDIGEEQLLMTMHGIFWRFPKSFRAKQSAGISPRSAYLKVVGDFCRWNDRLVFGCDDTARSEFLNKRKAKGEIIGPGQSQSNLWFLAPDQLDRFGPPLGRGAVWLNEPVKADTPSEPYLFAGFERRAVHLAADRKTTFVLEIDVRGDGEWTTLREVPVDGNAWIEFPAHESGAWIRARARDDCGKATATFHYSNASTHTSPTPKIEPSAGGLLYARGADKRSLAFATRDGYYEMDGNLKLKRVDDPQAAAYVREKVAIPNDVLSADAASILYVDESGGRWRLPRGEITQSRVCREVCTERDLFHAGGTFYELPANNAGGFSKIRPVATHGLPIVDYCSYRGMLVMSGVTGDSTHSIRSDDGRGALWVGAVDDLWRFGKPVGVGGPWHQTAVEPNQPSDPYLMTGYDAKRLTATHAATSPVTFRVQVDISGAGQWIDYLNAKIAPGETFEHRFPAAFSAYWIRLTSDAATTATATLHYE